MRTAQAFEQCQQTATDLISKKILVSMIVSDAASKSFMGSYGCLQHLDVIAEAEKGTDISEVCKSIANVYDPLLITQTAKELY